MAGLKLLITGRPGAGKTTLVMNVVERLRGSLRLAGFTTAEVRDPSGERTGFQILTVEGKQAELARAGFRSSVQVGRYGVYLEAFERLALPELARRDADLIVIDEIGKMECASDRFCHAVEDALDAQVNVLATLGIARLPFLESVRRRDDVELLTLTERNRNALVLELCCRFHGSRVG
jgi:nucleoside-triphosphatase THEP1